MLSGCATLFSLNFVKRILEYCLNRLFFSMNFMCNHFILAQKYPNVIVITTALNLQIRVDSCLLIVMFFSFILSTMLLSLYYLPG